MMRTGWCWRGKGEIGLASACRSSISISQLKVMPHDSVVCVLNALHMAILHRDPTDSFVVQCVLDCYWNPFRHGTSMILSLFLFLLLSHTPVWSVVLTQNERRFLSLRPEAVPVKQWKLRQQCFFSYLNQCFIERCCRAPGLARTFRPE